MATDSPWGKTKVIRSGDYLDILKIRTVPEDSDDVKYEIQPQYHQRPDLLAYDMYGSPKLWWVFAQRNMNELKDPIYDPKILFSLRICFNQEWKHCLIFLCRHQRNINHKYT